MVRKSKSGNELSEPVNPEIRNKYTGVGTGNEMKIGHLGPLN